MTIKGGYIFMIMHVFFAFRTCVRETLGSSSKKQSHAQRIYIYVFSYFTLLFCDICTHHFHQIAKNYH